jgi:autotransporter strand-loop-strand O-heptosyltransferase
MYNNIERNNDIIVSVKLNIHINYIDGPFVEVKNAGSKRFFVEFINAATGKVEHSGEIGSNEWIRASKRYYVDWLIKINGQEYRMNLEGKKVLICVESSSLGDGLAWMPYVEEFRKKHKCEMVCSAFLNDHFKTQYPDIEFVPPGSIVYNLTAQYRIGWYYNDEDSSVDLFRNPSDFKKLPLQQTASDILGLNYQEIRPKLQLPDRNIKKQIGVAIHGTCQSKYWNNPTGWQEVVDYLLGRGYEVILLSKEGDGYMGNKHPIGVTQLAAGSLENVIKTLRECEAFIGIGSGLSWLSWACEVPTYIISGFSEPYTETISDTIRIEAPEGKCRGCFNRCRLNAGDWNWCPDHKNTDKQFECSKSITGEMIINQLKNNLKWI